MDQETWKDIDLPGYQVSDLGRVRSLKGETKILATPVAPDGRAVVSLSCKGKTVRRSLARLVAKAFLPNPQDYKYVLHNSDDATDNKVSNLYWSSDSLLPELRVKKNKALAEKSRKKDGLEKEFGPMPPRDPDLVDWVVILRVAKEGSSPRQLTRAEISLLTDMGLYRQYVSETSRIIQPAWNYRHYGREQVRSGVSERIYSGGSHVRDIENQVLRILRETVSV